MARVYGGRPSYAPYKHVALDTSAPHFATMADRWGTLGQQSNGHGGKVRGRSVQSDVFYRARKWRPPINTCQMRGGTATWPPWLVDGALWDNNLSAIAAKLGCYFAFGTCFQRGRGRGKPLARERRDPRSRSVVFYRALSHRIAPFPCRSALQARILDSLAEFGVPGRGRNCAW